MGWRAWDAYEQEAKDRWRALPWCSRYSWHRISIFGLIVALAAAYVLAKIVH